MLVARGDEGGDSKRQLKSSRGGTDGVFLGEGDESTEKSARSRMNLEKDNLFFTHVRALWAKRAANFRRDKKAWCCTTILPALFVLMGLLIFRFAGQDRTMDPITLRVEDYNSDVDATPRNPITVNNVEEVFHCQPGRCAYEAGNFPFLHPDYSDNYLLCGIQALVNPIGEIDFESILQSGFEDLDVNSIFGASNDYLSCTIDPSTPFMGSITNAGIETIEASVNTIANVSYLVSKNRQYWARSQILSLPFVLLFLSPCASLQNSCLTISNPTRPRSTLRFSTPTIARACWTMEVPLKRRSFKIVPTQET